MAIYIKDYYEFINESINDKYLLKAIVIAGGTGSGKSFIADSMFKGLPVVFINSDNDFEVKMKKSGMSLKMDNSSDEDVNKRDKIRSSAKKITKIKANNWINSLLPVIVDGTGKEYEKIKDQRKVLLELGYDVSMIFVNTSLDVALERNQKRERTVPVDIATDAWNGAQQNIGRFSSLFNNNNGLFHIIDNSTVLDGNELVRFQKMLTKIAYKILEQPLFNNDGIKLLNDLKNNNFKYRSDLYPSFADLRI